jgi:hypothetical protein
VNSRSGPATVVDMGGIDRNADRVATFLASDPELEARLPAIEERVLHHFGPGATVKRKVIEAIDDPDGRDEFYLRVYADRPTAEMIDRLGELLEHERDLLAPVKDRLTIGFLG